MKILRFIVLGLIIVSSAGCTALRRGRVSYTLDSGVELNRQYPATFEIPSAEERNSLKAGQIAKLIFRISHGQAVDVERMWVVVTEKHPNYYVGTLDNDPTSTDKIRRGMKVRFQPEHIIQIWEDR